MIAESFITIVLCQPSHPGNIGAVARAMKNMGLTQLTLVAPRLFPHPNALERASGADDILANAQIMPTLQAALANQQWVFGTSARSRNFPWPQIDCKQAAQQAIKLAQQEQRVALVFGPEQSGLSNEQLALCDYHLMIPTNPKFSSLNLAAAVQIMTYELYQQAQIPLIQEKVADKVTHAQLQSLLAHFETAAQKLGLMDDKQPQKLIPRLQRLLIKAQLETEEVNILRGFCRAAINKTT